MNKKTIYYSLLIIPISLMLLLITFFLTNIWKPTIIATIFITILLIIVGILHDILSKIVTQNLMITISTVFEDNFKHWFWKLGIIGFIADFCDTIGISSFAVRIILLKLTKQVRNDKKIVGIMNVGHSIPTCLEAIIFIALIQVAWPTLVSLIFAATLGAYIGAIIANKIKLSWSQLFIRVLLFIVSMTMLLGQKQIGIMPTAGIYNNFDIWWKYAVGISVFFMLGAFMALDVGIYAPAMATTYLLGLSAECAYPIMMGSAAFLMPMAGTRFIKDKNYEIKPAIVFTLGGSIGVICAYLSVSLLLQNGLGLNKEQFINILLSIIIVVIWYTSASLIITAIKNLGNSQKVQQKPIIDS